MVTGNAILVLDLGNSSTKATVKFGKNSSGRYYGKTYDLSNRFALLPSDYKVAEEYTDENSTIIDVDTYVGNNHVLGRFCNGALQEREFPLVSIKPGARDKKWNLDASALSIRLAFLFAFRGIMQLSRCYDPEQFDISWSVVALLPAGDLDAGREKLTQLIMSCDLVTSVLPEMRFDVNVNNVTVLAEGFCAFAGILYDSGRTLRTGYEYLKNETVLLFDIGAGTTNCMLIRENQLVQGSKYTISQGGNNVTALVRNKLMFEGLDVDDSSVRSGVISGFVRDGAKNIDITEHVDSAKLEVASKIVSSFEDYLNTLDIKMRSIGYILICGGGSQVGSADTPLSEAIITAVRRIAPNIGVLEIPSVVRKVRDVDTDEVIEKCEQISPRMLNLIGAGVLAETIYK